MTINVYLSVVKELQKDDDVIFDWLVETTEDFCKDKAVYNAIVDGIAIIDGKDKKRGVDAFTFNSYRRYDCWF